MEQRLGPQISIVMAGKEEVNTATNPGKPEKRKEILQ
jgi:hypothetical protein